ncbi:MAG TPA: bacillithiol biosynthesis BshC [Candidatus Eisenbacteria bacterium]
MTRTLAVRARVEPRPEPRFARLFDPLTHDLVHRGPLSRERFATAWSDTGALTRLAEAKRAPLPSTLARELGEHHRRLGASAASLAALDRLARGEAVCAIAGQQPAPLGGPLYSIHKIASTVGIARAFAARTGHPCVPVFWMHGEDSDFDEIRSAWVADAALTQQELSLPAAAHVDGGLVGSIDVAPLAALEEEAARRWEALPAASEALAVLARSRAAARDLGEAQVALALALFGEAGLVVVDPRLPAFRAAARGVIERYLVRAEALSAAARAAGETLERGLGRRPLADAALESFVFAIEDGRRRKVTPAEARGAGTLSPSVALRPVVQDGVLPTVAMACGPGELAYLAQLAEIYAGLEVRAACPVPRLSATWLPPPAVEMLEATGADPWELVTAADQVLKAHAEKQVPEDARAALEQARSEALAGLERFAAASRRVDASLPQMVESARAKVDFQFARLHEGLAGKVRHQLERRNPEWLRVRYYLMPGDRLQERRLASLEPVAYRGAAVALELADLGAEHAERLAGGAHEHVVAEL